MTMDDGTWRSQLLSLDNVSIVNISGAHNAPDSRTPFSGRYNIPLRQRGWTYKSITGKSWPISRLWPVAKAANLVLYSRTLFPPISHSSTYPANHHGSTHPFSFPNEWVVRNTIYSSNIIFSVCYLIVICGHKVKPFERIVKDGRFLLINKKVHKFSARYSTRAFIFTLISYYANCWILQ